MWSELLLLSSDLRTMVFLVASFARNQIAKLPELSDAICLGNQTSSNDAYSFEAKWVPVSKLNASKLNHIKSGVENITCDLWEATYTFDVSFHRGL